MINDFTYQLGKQVLDAINLRQQTIAHNIANVNTAGYKSKQVIFESELKNYINNGFKINTNLKREFGSVNNGVTLQPKVVESSATSQMNLDGNNVDIDLEMANMAANQIQYNTLIRQVSDRISNYHYVIRGQ
ncbi:flagellar basal body rod protein FlgB [Turicibacter sanguinis]|uniref:flagellar basal body rod protein FlgB n=1 Tax=Turicibacter sanguinis TaxID=154288 RepID=UPI0018A89CD3|nr:flagellar basal body rod protein FlgB [Turicibacter sanguinis]MDB8551149.1 flagellar basal body rod protein FlgB [Turicibacter sanguinis]